jgi:hypothetical protein
LAGTYLDAGYYGLKDCWEYDITSNSWEMVAYMPQFFSSGITFTYNNIIYAGLGHVLTNYEYTDEQNFYKLDL